MHRVHATTQQQFSRGNGFLWGRLEATLVYPMLYPVKVYRCIRPRISKNERPISLCQRTTRGRTHAPVNEPALGEQLGDWCLATLEAEFRSGTRTRILAIGTTSGRTTISRTLTSANSFLLWTRLKWAEHSTLWRTHVVLGAWSRLEIGKGDSGQTDTRSHSKCDAFPGATRNFLTRLHAALFVSECLAKQRLYLPDLFWIYPIQVGTPGSSTTNLFSCYPLSISTTDHDRNI